MTIRKTDYTPGLLSMVGNTPLLKLESLSKATGCTILGKAEFLNPGGSVKDRAAKAIIEKAEAEGKLKKGGTIVEGTAGNTGISLAHFSNLKGYRCIVVLPDNQAADRIEILRSLEAQVRQVPPSRYGKPGNYAETAKKLAEGIPGGFFANQFENLANFDAHFGGTGPEIWKQTGGMIDAFVCGAGTGGTLAGVSAFLKKRKKEVVTWLADPNGSALLGILQKSEVPVDGRSMISGVGCLVKTANFAKAKLDGAMRISDQETIEMAYYLMRSEGLFLGGSSAMNCVAAVKLARTLGFGKVVVTMLCDGGARYVSSLYHPRWQEEHGLVPRSRSLDFIRE